MPTTCSTSPSPRRTTGRRTWPPTAAAWPTSWSTTGTPAPSCTARRRRSTSPRATASSTRTARSATTTACGRSCARTASAKSRAEGTARWAAERFGLPTTIARLSVPYGDNGGWPAIHLHMMLSGHAIPVHVDAPSVYHPLHADDILAMVPRLLAAASTPAVTVNWGGSEPVSIEEWCTYLAGLAGAEARFEPTDEHHRQRRRSTPRGCTSWPGGRASRGARACTAWPRRCIPIASR